MGVQFVDIDGVSIAYRIDEPARGALADAPLTVLWLNGLASDMEGAKATAVARWCQTNGHRCLRMDYSGHGESGGNFEDGSLSLWLNQVYAVARRFCHGGAMVICGSSMGGWLALLLAQRWLEGADAAAARLSGLLLLAPAFEMTERCVKPELSAQNWRELEEAGSTTVRRSAPEGSGEEDMVYTVLRDFLEDGDSLNFGGSEIDLPAVVRILHGGRDDVVSIETALACLGACNSPDARATVIRDGDHRLSREEDIVLLLQTLEEISSRRTTC